MWRSLLWKEWREQRWKAAFGSVVLGSVAMIGLKTRIIPDLELMSLTFVLSTFLFPIFVGIGLVSAEREETTLPFLLRAPVPNWVTLATKILVGAFVLLLPVVAACMVYAAVGWNREVASWKVLFAGPLYWWLSVELLVWSLAFGINQERQDRAAIVSVLLLMGWWVWVIAMIHVLTIEGWVWLKCLLALQPLGYGMYTDSRFVSLSPWLFAMVHVTGLALVCVWMFRRYPSNRSPQS